MGVTHLDAGVVIGFLDGDDAHHPAARAVLSGALQRRDRLVMAASALAECLVGPSRVGPESVATARTAIARIPIAIVDLDSDIAVEAAGLRSRHRTLRLPDALVIATAITTHAARLVTTDRRWPSSAALALDLNIEHV